MKSQQCRFKRKEMLSKLSCESESRSTSLKPESCKLPVTCVVNFRFLSISPPGSRVQGAEGPQARRFVTCHPKALNSRLQDMTQHCPDKQVWLTGKRTMCRQRGRNAGTKCRRKASTIKPLLMRDNGCGLALWKSFGLLPAQEVTHDPSKVWSL